MERSRAASLGDNARAFQADVREAADVQRLVAEVTEAFGAPTTLVHNALQILYLTEMRGRDCGDGLGRHDARPNGFTWCAQFDPRGEAITAQRNFGRIIHIGTNLFQNPVVPYRLYCDESGIVGPNTYRSCRIGARWHHREYGFWWATAYPDASAATPEAVFDFIAQSTPLRSVTTPEELADTVLFFASPWGRAVTGQNLVVDGGLVFN